MSSERPPLPHFITSASAAIKVRLAEYAWNSRDPERVSLTPDDHPSLSGLGL